MKGRNGFWGKWVGGVFFRWRICGWGRVFKKFSLGGFFFVFLCRDNVEWEKSEWKCPLNVLSLNVAIFV